MMLYAKLIADDTLYIFLHAEQVYRNFTLCDKDLGYFNNNSLMYSSDDILGYSSNKLTEDTICDVCNYFDNNKTPNNIIIDCAEIKEAHNITGWIKKITQYCTDHKKKLAFCRMSEDLYCEARIDGYKDLSKRHNKKAKLYNLCNSGCTKKSINDDCIYDIYKQIITKKTKSNYIIKRSGKNSYSYSSNVQLPKYINIKAYIEQKEIVFLGMYLLCKKAYNKKLIGHGKQPLLFFSSMAGSYLASVFSKLACIDMVFLNHLGPKKKLYRELHKEQLIADRDYLIISDVVCLGAEIERAKTLIEYVGGNLKGILSVVLVDVVSQRPIMKENDIDKIALLTLTKKYNTINYQIKTDFE